MYIKMKLKLAIIVLAAVVFAACDTGIGSKSVSLKTQADSASYAIGVIIGEQNKQTMQLFPGSDQLSREIILKAFNDYFVKDDSKMTLDETQTIVQNFAQGEMTRKSEKNTAEAEAFLEKNKTKAGIVTLESGLQYEILKEGTGAKPTVEQVVKCHYHGTSLDGKIFESSVDRGEPAQFEVVGVIPGWTEALQLMPVGSKWKLYIPGELAYGEYGRGQDIGPNQLLIFEIELLEIIED